MDALLIIVTGLSLGLAVVMATLLGRTLRDERRRSDARVALLTELASEPPVRPAKTTPASSRVSAPTVRPHSTVGLNDLDLRPVQAPATSALGLFQRHDEPSAWPRRVAVAGAAAAVLAVLVFGWSAMRGRVVPAESRVAASLTPQALELRSLGHVESEGALTIRGVVHNPAGGAAVSRVDAVALVYGADGTLLTSGRAPIDGTGLAPGAQSPFVVRVSVNGIAARYRVSFRGEDDRVIAHVDRRDHDALARKDVP
ncbi:MAG: hypothetical protein H0W08_26795 [Acidobacteria bacterium]|nr:hypothetical protein [Acidobacteriota bacterium]